MGRRGVRGLGGQACGQHGGLEGVLGVLFDM